MYIGSFQSDGDAVQEDENQDHVVEQFVRDHALAPRAASKQHTRTTRASETESSIRRLRSVKTIDHTISSGKAIKRRKMRGGNCGN